MKGPLKVTIQGRPNTGKTTFMRKVQKLAEQEGFRVMAFDNVIEDSEDARTPIDMKIGDMLLVSFVS